MRVRLARPPAAADAAAAAAERTISSKQAGSSGRGLVEQLRPESERKGKDSAASISPVLSKTKDGEEEGGVNWNHVFAGALARTLAQVFVHPIDTVKTRLQVSEPPKKLVKWRNKLSKPKNMLKVPLPGGPVAMKNFAFKGTKDIYRGVMAAWLGTFPTSLIYFSTYGIVKEILERVTEKSDARVHLASASIGALASSVLRVPGDTIRHQTQAYMHRNVFRAFSTIVTANGAKGLYLGYLPTLLRDVPEMAIQFSVYETLRKLVMNRRGGQKLYTWEHLLLGGVAGAAAACCTMPMDFVKTRQQCGQRLGVIALVQLVHANDGLGGLFKGLGPRVAHVALTSATFFALFEYTKLLLKPQRVRGDFLLLPKLIRKRRDHVWKRQLVIE